MFGKKRLPMMMYLNAMLVDGRTLESRCVQVELDTELLDAIAHGGVVAPRLTSQGKFRVGNYTPGPAEPCDMRKIVSRYNYWPGAEYATAEGIALAEEFLAKLNAGEPTSWAIEGRGQPVMIDADLITPTLTLNVRVG